MHFTNFLLQGVQLNKGPNRAWKSLLYLCQDQASPGRFHAKNCMQQSCQSSHPRRFLVDWPWLMFDRLCPPTLRIHGSLGCFYSAHHGDQICMTLQLPCQPFWLLPDCLAHRHLHNKTLVLCIPSWHLLLKTHANTAPNCHTDPSTQGAYHLSPGPLRHYHHVALFPLSLCPHLFLTMNFFLLISEQPAPFPHSNHHLNVTFLGKPFLVAPSAHQTFYILWPCFNFFINDTTL